MIKRTHRRIAAVAGVALAIGFAAPASAIFLGTTAGSFLDLNLDNPSIGTSLPSSLPLELAPNFNFLDAQVDNGLVDSILDRVIGQGDLLTELTGASPLVVAPLAVGPVVGPTTVPFVVGTAVATPILVLAAIGSIF